MSVPTILRRTHVYFKPYTLCWGSKGYCSGLSRVQVPMSTQFYSSEKAGASKQMLTQGVLREPYHPRIETVAIMAAHAPEMDQRFLPQTRPFTEMDTPLSQLVLWTNYK